MKALNKKQIELLIFLKSGRIILIPIEDNKRNPSMITTPYEKINGATLRSLQRRGFVDSQEESDGYNTGRITNSGINYLTDHGA